MSICTYNNNIHSNVSLRLQFFNIRRCRRSYMRD